MNIGRKTFTTGKPGQSQSAELNSSFNFNDALESTRKWNRCTQLWMFRRLLGQTFNFYNCGGGYFYGGCVRSSVKDLTNKRGPGLKDDLAQ